jgi:hypothetical protein
MAEVTEDKQAAGQLALRTKLEESIVHKDEQGHVTLSISPAMSAQMNVLAPTAIIAQEDPFFRPGFTVVTLDPDKENGADFYNMKGKWAPTKVALQKLGDAAGVTFDPSLSHGITGKVEEVELKSGKKVRVDSYTYHAVGYVRRSDGTNKTLTADEEWIPWVALSECKDDKEFIFSARKRAQMIRSKAMNGVLRQALSIKQAYTQAEAHRPFFVVGYNWSPDVTDPNTAKIIASLVGADTAALYGPAETQAALPSADDAPFIEADEAEGADIPFAQEYPAEEAPEGVDPVTGEVVDEAETIECEPVEEAAAEPVGLTDEETKRFEALADHILTIGDYEGMTIGAAFAKDPDYFQTVADWYSERVASKKPVAPPTKKQVLLMAEFVALYNTATGGAE